MTVCLHAPADPWRVGPGSVAMYEHEEPARQAYLSRSEVEMELARIALVVMRTTPASFAEIGLGRVPDDGEGLSERCTRLLLGTAPEHRPFVEDRLLELARSLAGGRADAGHEWFNVTLECPTPASRARSPSGNATR